MKVDITIYLELKDISNKEIFRYIIDNMDYLLTKGMTYEFLVTCDPAYQLFINSDMNPIFIEKKDLDKTAQGSFIAIFDERYAYPDYRLHFQWRSITVFNKTKPITTNSFVAYYDKKNKKTYIQYNGISGKEALFYRKGSIPIKDLSKPINSFKNVVVDNEICLVVDQCESQPPGSKFFCDDFIKMEVVPNFINAG